MPRASLRRSFVILAALTLGSCSYAYELLAVVIDGRLAFIVDPSSDQDPDCIGGIHVLVDNGGPIAEVESGDDEKLVRNGGAYWWKTTEVTHCENPFPIFYGQKIEGPPFMYDDGPSSVEPKPLRVGVIYEVNTSSRGSGYGSGWFRITKQGRVENFKADPTPPVTNEEGYDITDYANMAQAPYEGVYRP